MKKRISWQGASCSGIKRGLVGLAPCIYALMLPSRANVKALNLPASMPNGRSPSACDA